MPIFFPPRSLYHAFRRKFSYSAKSLTIVVIALFFTLNFLVYINYSDLFTVSVLDPELPVERRESSSYVRTEHRSFPPTPEWIPLWFSSQRIDPMLDGSIGRDLAIDVVYTWVNGSDPKLRTVKEQYEDTSPFFQRYREIVNPERSRINGSLFGEGFRAGRAGRAGRFGASTEAVDQTANRYRDMDELRYSVRSVAEYAKKMYDRIHILTAVVDMETQESQVPSWLDVGVSWDVVQLVPHNTIFDNKTHLPSFNSLAIESQLHHIPMVTDIFLYLNDDVFLGTQMAAADVWTPLYGFVFHMEPTLLVPPFMRTPELTLEVGEWDSLQYSNYLLSKQFGPRYRSYLAHVPHVLSAPMLHEIQSIWPEELKETSSHRFRGEGLARDVHTSFFMAHYVAERLRETQLSSFWFNRLDANQDGVLEWSERERFLQRVDNWNRVQISKSARYPPTPYFRNFSSYVLNYEGYLRQLGLPPTGSSIYRMSGLDGYPFMLKSANTTSTVYDWDSKPYLVYDEIETRRCHLDIDFCFGSRFQDSSIDSIDYSSSDAIFQRLAFSEFHCGDCLLHMLRQTATERGLGSEILPLDTESDAYRDVTSDLAKYNYVVATSPYSFVSLRDAFGSQNSLSQIMSKKDTEAFFCINDNVSGNPRVEGMVRQVFKNFLDERFPKSSPWEKP